MAKKYIKNADGKTYLDGRTGLPLVVETSGQPQFKYTLTDLMLDPTKTDWNCFWFDDFDFSDNPYRNQFQAGTGCTGNTSTKALVYFTLENGGNAYINAGYSTWQSFGFSGNGGGYGNFSFRRYGTSANKQNFYKFFPLCSPVVSITFVEAYLKINEETRKKVADHICFGVI